MIKQIFAFESMEEFKNYEDEIRLLNNKLNTYQELLINQFELKVLPKTIVWTSSENATTVFSEFPVPAFTNRETIYMSPSVKEWKKFYHFFAEDLSLKERSE